MACALHTQPIPISALKSTVNILPQLDLRSNRQKILNYFDDGWALTELLFSGLASNEAFYQPPYHQLRHPLIFYYGHPASLYINKLRVAGLLEHPLNAEFEVLFETGVDEMRWDTLYESKAVWPTLEAVREYRRDVYAVVRRLIEEHPLLAPEHLPITMGSPMWALVMAFEHERIHLETSSVLMRELPIEHVRRPQGWPEFVALKTEGHFPENPMIDMPACEVALGKPRDFPSFGWDNEYGKETRDVKPFSASRQLISNGEFYAFVTAGGYTQRQYWSEEGWAWRSYRNSKAPVFWVQEGPAGLHRYKLRTVFDMVDMQWDWPVCVNFHEAKAFCAWRNMQESGANYRLLTEAEHHALRGECAANIAFVSGGESPVNAFPANAKGFHDVFGNVWQWCEDHFHPLSDFQPHPYYDDFSVPCFDGAHQMMLGGSFISTGDEASAFARFHFRPHFFQHAGFRLARSTDGGCGEAHYIHQPPDIYERTELLNRYMLMHWGEQDEIIDASLGKAVTFANTVHLPIYCAELAVQFAGQTERALDLGCAVGRTAFELARTFPEVMGIDYSHAFIRAAEALQHTGEMAYVREDGTSLVARVDNEIDRKRVRFAQGDACALAEDILGFDAVVLANVLCRLPDPAACLARMQGKNALVRPGGILVMTTPLSWQEQYTPKSRWLQGISDIARLLPEFTCIHSEDIAFVLREHHRKYEYIIPRASVWRRQG